MTEAVSEQSTPLILEERWHLRKEVNVSHLLTTAALVATVLYSAHTFDVRLTLVESRTLMQTQIDNAQNEARREAFGRVDKALEQISEKIDRLIERDRALSKRQSSGANGH